MQSLTSQTLKIFWQHAKKYRWHVFSGLLFLVISRSAEATGPFLYRTFINTISTNDHSKYGLLIKILVLIITVRAVRSYSYRVKDFITAYFEARVMADLNNTCFAKMHEQTFSFFSGNFVGSLVNKVKKFERAFEVVADRIHEDFLGSFLTIIFSGIVLSFRHWLLTVALWTWCLVYFLIIYYFSIYKLKFDLKKAALDTQLTGILADTITNNVNIKLFSNLQNEKKNFSAVNEEHFKVRRFAWDLMTYLEIAQGTLMLSIEFLMMYFAVRFWKQGMLTVGDFTLIQLYLISIFDKLWSMGKQIRAFYEALADGNEMTEILLAPVEVKDLANAKRLAVYKGSINFNKVNFAYHTGKKVLQDFNFSITPGEKIALIGPSGGGKTTIVKLLFRLYDLQSGQIFIDATDIKTVTQDSLRAAMSLVPQEPILFHRSLLENIRYAKPGATDKEVFAAAKLAHAHEFISAFSTGYNTMVGERGIKLSGGERQRVAIARAILKNAPILVLDEATSSLDSESESLIQDALKTLMKDKTVIVIAHRLSTIMQMDRIVVVEAGRIVEQGKHEELLKARQGVYQKLWKIQAGGFAV